MYILCAIFETVLSFAWNEVYICVVFNTVVLNV